MQYGTTGQNSLPGQKPKPKIYYYSISACLYIVLWLSYPIIYLGIDFEAIIPIVLGIWGIPILVGLVFFAKYLTAFLLSGGNPPPPDHWIKAILIALALFAFSIAIFWVITIFVPSLSSTATKKLQNWGVIQALVYMIYCIFKRPPSPPPTPY